MRTPTSSRSPRPVHDRGVRRLGQGRRPSSSTTRGERTEIARGRARRWSRRARKRARCAHRLKQQRNARPPRGSRLRLAAPRRRRAAQGIVDHMAEHHRADPDGASWIVRSLDGGLEPFWDRDLGARGMGAALKLTLIASLIVIVAINAVVGTMIAWVLVRDEFRGKRIVNSIIDLPFALPTIVAGSDPDRAVRGRQPVRDQRHIHHVRRRAGAAVRDPAVRGQGGAAGAARARPARWRRRRRRLARAAHGSSGSIVLPNLRRRSSPAVGAGVRPRDRRVRLAGADHREHPVRDPGRLRVYIFGRIEQDQTAPRRCRLRAPARDRAGSSCSLIRLVARRSRHEAC